MKFARDKVCILNSFDIFPNYGGPTGVFREAFLKVNGPDWEMRSYADVRRLPALVRKARHRAIGPLLKGYSRDAHLHRQIAHDAAYFSGVSGIRQYPVVWFSDLLQYFSCRPLLAPGQRAVLHLHSPALPSIEAQEQAWCNYHDRRLIARIERWALQDADLLVLANRGAERIYGDLRNGKPIAHLQNAMSGEGAGEVPALSVSHTNFLYVGRRIGLKGFDLLIAAFREAYARNPMLRLYLLGNGEPCLEPGMVDLQFSRVPEKWIAAASCVVIPNRSSYLDLNLLEALSLNAPVMMTCTEGHEMFLGAGPGIYPVPSATVEALRDALLAAPDWLAGMQGQQPTNRELFERDFSLEKFASRLNEICAALLGKAPL